MVSLKKKIKYMLTKIKIVGLDKIEYLQTRKNMEIIQKSYDMIQQYFIEEENTICIYSKCI